jgi:anthranilate phosphoribosyltransferase
MQLLDGGGPDAIRDAALVNAGAGLVVYGLAADLAEGYATARQALASGAVKEKLAEICNHGAVYEHH